MISLKTSQEQDKMRTAGFLVADVLKLMRELVRPGVTTMVLDKRADELIARAGATPAFRGYRVPGVPVPFPGTICASINCEVVHGIPSEMRVLQEGDILSVDVGVYVDGFCGDAACTYPVGEVSPLRRKLLEVTERSLMKGLAAVIPGATVGDVGHSVEACVKSEGFGLVRDYAGHGIGKKMHEPPQVPNYGKPGSGVMLKPGMTFCVEPMVMTGGEAVKSLKDGWTVVTVDGSDAAHFEHTILVTQEGYEIFTPWQE